MQSWSDHHGHPLGSVQPPLNDELVDRNSERGTHVRCCRCDAGLLRCESYSRSIVSSCPRCSRGEVVDRSVPYVKASGSGKRRLSASRSTVTGAEGAEGEVRLVGNSEASSSNLLVVKAKKSALRDPLVVEVDSKGRHEQKRRKPKADLLHSVHDASEGSSEVEDGSRRTES